MECGAATEGYRAIGHPTIQLLYRCESKRNKTDDMRASKRVLYIKIRSLTVKKRLGLSASFMLNECTELS